MLEYTLNMYQTAGVAMLLFVLGRFLTNRVQFLKACCIPAPVVGGLIFALVHLGLYAAGVLALSFDSNVKDYFMTLFFTSVGYTACFRLLKKGGKKVFTFLAIAIVMVILPGHPQPHHRRGFQDGRPLRPSRRLHPHGGRTRHCWLLRS